MNRRLRVAIHISTWTGDHWSSSSEASCKFILACPSEAFERRVETETTSRLIEWPSHPRASEYARKRPGIGECQMMEG